jgi:oxygen-independent coproporphyrinogen-3 oxidase
MPGIYLHIPFCKQACHYCNFHFSTSLKYKGEVVEAMLRELELQRDYLPAEPLTSIYFGGGTPSLLSGAELERLFEQINRLWSVAPDAEITLEANPDDLSKEKVAELHDSPVNRLSIGIQSFSEEDLQFMNRAHNAREARQCLEWAVAAGFKQLTADLIYGSPTTSDAQWRENIRILTDYGIPHLSCYCLTVEPRTALAHFVEKGKVSPVDEEQAARQFDILIDELDLAGYEHYEISNFAKPGFYARHNSSYWLGEPYLGVGPSAHSYDGRSRQWNVANNAKYLRALQSDAGRSDLEGSLFEKEMLTPAQRYDEYVLTRLRTRWGCRSEDLEEPFRTHFTEKVREWVESGDILLRDGVYTLSRSGKLLADRISMELFYD